MRVITDKGMSIWVFPKIVVFPPKWMVKIMESPIRLDDFGYHYFRKHPYISRNLDGSKAKLRNTRSPCRSIHRHTETEVFHVVFRHVLEGPVTPNLRRCLDIGSSQISNKKISSPTHNLSNTPRDRDKKHPWVRRGNRVPCCTCCTCLETNGKVNFRCNWPRKKRQEDRFEVFLVPCLGQKWCWCVSVCWDEWGRPRC